MIKTILKLLVEVLGKKLIKAGLEETLLKNQAYISAAKQIWNVVEENFRITETIEEKIASKADSFDKMLLTKFPELTQSDVTELRQAVAGEVNVSKGAVLSEIDALKQLQDSNLKLVGENTELRNKLATINAQSTVVNADQEAVTQA
ncbi:hypothetical protein [Clostridium saccharoperbutylacetonicum]|uniref:hypothetical protein n=1 Tax=Clostridium saccharoperbutylacetonicum TaxID=36745 RepID=UPI0039E7E193